MMSIPSKMVIIITQFQQDFRWNLELILNLHGRRKVHQQLKKFLKRRVKRINSHYLILRHTVLSCTLPDIKTYYTELSFLCFIAVSTSYLFYTWDGGWGVRSKRVGIYAHIELTHLIVQQKHNTVKQSYSN